MLHFMNCYRNSWCFSCFVALCLLFVTYCCECLWNLIYLLLLACVGCYQKEENIPFPTSLFVSSFISTFSIKTSDFIVASCALCLKFLIFAPCLAALGKLRVKLSLHRK